MIEMPKIDLSGIVPVAALGLIAVVCIVVLLVHSILRSRIALLIAVVIGVAAAGPTIAFALAQIVGALVPLGIVVVIGGVAGVWLLQRNPELMALVRDVVPRRIPPSPQPSPLKGEGGRTVVIDQLPAPRQSERRRQDGDKWGF